MKEGLHTEWYENGQTSFDRNYKNGKLDGFWSFWDKKGHLLSSEIYKDGVIISKMPSIR